MNRRQDVEQSNLVTQGVKCKCSIPGDYSPWQLGAMVGMQMFPAGKVEHAKEYSRWKSTKLLDASEAPATKSRFFGETA